MKKTARLNEAWDAAVDFIRSGDIDGLKKVLDENDEELVNWGHDEYAGCTLLRASTELVRESFMSVLLDRGADVNVEGSDGGTALMIASLQGHPSCISLLLDRGADVNAKTNNGATALMLASLHGHPSCISMLLDRGADVDAIANDGVTTASSLATDREIIRMLARARAAKNRNGNSNGNGNNGRGENGRRGTNPVLDDDTIDW